MTALDPKGLQAAMDIAYEKMIDVYEVEAIVRAYLDAAETFRWEIGKTYELRVSTADLSETAHGVDELMAALKGDKP